MLFFYFSFVKLEKCSNLGDLKSTQIGGLSGKVQGNWFVLKNLKKILRS